MAPVRSCVVVSDRPALAADLTALLGARDVRCHRVDPVAGFDKASATLRAAAEAHGPVDAVVVATEGRGAASASAAPVGGWAEVLAAHDGIVDDIHADAGWARAVADYAARGATQAVRLVTLTDARTDGGRSRAQAAAQLARAAKGATERKVIAFAAGLETDETDGADGTDRTDRTHRAGVASPTSELVAHLLCRGDTAALAGAELVVGSGWIGLRSHPRPTGSVVFGGPAVPIWLDDALKEIVGEQ